MSYRHVACDRNPPLAANDTANSCGYEVERERREAQASSRRPQDFSPFGYSRCAAHPMIIRLTHCTVSRTDFGCVTRFDDGSFVNSAFHPNDHHYYALAHRLGYEDDIHAFCVEHDFAHSFLSEKFYGKPSPILWALAHGAEPPHPAMEEMACQVFQRYLRANELPIVGSVDWGALKREAITLLAA
jgi:hypothetical protein